MNCATETTPIRMVTLSRLVLALVMAFLLGSLVAQSVEAKTVPLSVSKSEYIRNSRTLCTDGGGTFTETTLQSGSTKTNCKGGANDGHTCVVTDKVADCQSGPGMPTPEASVPDEISAPPTEGVYEEPARSVQDDVSAPPFNGTYEDPAGGNVTAGGAVVESSGFAKQPEDLALIAAETVPVEPVLEAGAAPASGAIASEPTPVIAK
jgi:hypothetical protein